MNNKDTKVPLPLKVRKSRLNEIEEEARKRGVPRSKIAEERINHYPIPLTPALMYELQNGANRKYEELKDDQPEEAVRIMKEVMKLWKLLK